MKYYRGITHRREIDIHSIDIASAILVGDSTSGWIAAFHQLEVCAIAEMEIRTVIESSYNRLHLDDYYPESELPVCARVCR